MAPAFCRKDIVVSFNKTAVNRPEVNCCRLIADSADRINRDGRGDPIGRPVKTFQLPVVKQTRPQTPGR
jgi:hypothetical protein